MYDIQQPVVQNDPQPRHQFYQVASITLSLTILYFGYNCEFELVNLLGETRLYGVPSLPSLRRLDRLTSVSPSRLDSQLNHVGVVVGNLDLWDDYV